MMTLQGSNRIRVGLLGLLIVAMVVAVGQSFASIPMLFAKPMYYADFADSADHFAVLALAGRALERHLLGHADAAVEDLLAARTLRPASFAESDGLARKPEAILRRVQKELVDQGKSELAARLD